MAKNKMSLTESWLEDEETRRFVAASYRGVDLEPADVSAKLSEFSFTPLTHHANRNRHYYLCPSTPSIVFLSEIALELPVTISLSERSSFYWAATENEEVIAFVGPLGARKTHAERAFIFDRNFEAINENEEVFLDIPEDLL
ncbi:MAG TPA: hypothetical protein VJ044_16930 [Candidatus Hodarchaeales archaeon]|nr:hypothetical protein [Candidatus Hodarchaeales archaeon]